ncbi:hypothetical protein [Citrobacter portucalensis]|uniref:hypothetical protein n=1 Tax=Citrobacter portucalensis TaxID=1639133 RepID=UPI0030CEF534|nr:hypothetical protein [Citrobacter freundii]
MTTAKHAARDAIELRPIYFTEAAKSINLNTVERALIEIVNKYPTENKYSFSPSYPSKHGKPVDILTEESGETFLDAVRHCVDWLTHFDLVKTQRKSFNTHRSAYGYKHAVERWVSHVKNHACGGAMRDYIPIHAFCVAAWILSIPEQSTGGGNPVYPLSKRTLDHAEYSYQPEPFARWSKAKHKATVANADRLTQLVQERGRVSLFDLETLPACSWWRALSFNERCAAVSELRHHTARRVFVSGYVGDQLVLIYAAPAAKDDTYQEAVNG